MDNSAQQCNTQFTQEQDSTVSSYTAAAWRQLMVATNNPIYRFSGDMTDERQNLASNTNKDVMTDSVGMSCFAVLINLLVEETNQL